MKKFIPIFDNCEARNLCSGDPTMDAMTLYYEQLAYDINGAAKYLDGQQPPVAPDPQFMKLPADPNTALSRPMPDPSDSRMTILLQQDTPTPPDYPLMLDYYQIATQKMAEYMKNTNPYE